MYTSWQYCILDTSIEAGAESFMKVGLSRVNQRPLDHDSTILQLHHVTRFDWRT